MNNSLKCIYNIIRLNTKLFKNVLEGINERSGKKRLNKWTNNISFLAIHLLDARYYLCSYLGSRVKNPFEKELKGIKSVNEMKRYPELREIIYLWNNISPKLEKRMKRISSTELKKKSKIQFPIDDHSKYGGLSFLIQHESYHIGQLGLLRKGLGLGSMKY